MSQAARSGGAILDLHIHDVDFCQYLLGLPERVQAYGGCSQGPAAGYDYVLANLDYGDGTQVSATAHWVDVPLPLPPASRPASRVPSCALIAASSRR